MPFEDLLLWWLVMQNFSLFYSAVQHKHGAELILVGFVSKMQERE